MDSTQSIDMLGLIYDKIKEFRPGYFAIKENERFGLATHDGKIYIEPSFKQAWYRNNYVILADNSGKNSASNGIVIFIPSGKKIKLGRAGGYYFTAYERPALDFGLLDIEILAECEEQKIETRRDCYDTKSSNKICTKRIANEVYRPFNNSVVEYFESMDNKKMGIIRVDDHFEAYPIEDALNKIYDNVKIQKGRTIKYNCTLNGETVVLNSHGQLY